MDNRLLVAELKAASPGAVEAIHDSYADGLFQYCWFVLRNSDAAPVALRDSLIVAAAHIARLDDPDLLKPWLYALARVECLRRRPSPASDPDILLARSERNGGDPALLAWRAVMDVGPLEREVLELSTRQRLDLRGVALVLGIGTREAELLLIRARESLAQAVAGEILGREGQGDCPDRAAMLTDYDGTLTAPLRERLVSHARRCTACGRHLPRNVSATKVYGLLTMPEPPEEMRMRTLACLGDPDLAGYRAFVAGRAGTFDMTGFPLAPATAAAAAAAAARRQPSSAHLWVGLAAALVATALGVGFAQSRPGGFETMIGSILPGPAGSLGHGTIATPALHPGGAPPRPVAPPSPSGPALPLGGLQAASPAGYLQLPSRRLDLGAASSGSLVITASEGPVAWSASTSSPDLVLSSRRGWLAKGGKVTLILSRARDSSRSSQAQVTIGPGNLSVLVTWISPSASSPPSPSPGPSARPSHASSPRPSRTRSSEPSPGPSAVRVEASVAGSPVSAPESGPLRRRGEARQQAQSRAPSSQDRPEPHRPAGAEPGPGRPAGALAAGPVAAVAAGRPGPWRQDRWRPGGRTSWGPGSRTGRGPGGRTEPGPWRQDQPGPWRQDQPGPWGQDQPGPWRQDEPGPWGQDQPGTLVARPAATVTAKVRNAGRSRGAGLISLGNDRRSRVADRARAPRPQDQSRTGHDVSGRAL